MGIYGSIPVGYYTGVPNISIPLYEIELDGKAFPINLSYHASGIKVNQDASQVGLGWTLNVGGSISRSIVDKDDFDYTSGYFFFKDLKEDKNDPFCYVNGERDSEPDQFMFNFGGHNGSFYINKIGQNNNTHQLAIASIVNNNSYLKIELVNVNSDSRYWKATDGDGYTYYFNSVETTTPLSSVSHGKFNLNYWNASYNSAIGDLKPEIQSSWLLDSIISPYGNNISFEYEFEYIYTAPSAHEDLWYLVDFSYYISDLQMRYYKYTRAKIKQAVLKKVNFNGGKININTSDRLDIQGEASKVDKIILSNTNDSIIKVFQFTYNYSGNTNHYNNCRLILNAITENNLKQYKFFYYKGSLPEKTSLKKDLWGFYSSFADDAIERDFFTMPSYIINRFGKETLLKGNDRYPIEEDMKALVLEKIEYPTGGQTIFEYEGHKASRSNYTSTRSEWSNVSRVGLGILVDSKLIGDAFEVTNNQKYNMVWYYERNNSSLNGLLASSMQLEKLDETDQQWKIFFSHDFWGTFYKSTLKYENNKVLDLDKGKYRLSIKTQAPDKDYYYKIYGEISAEKIEYYTSPTKEQVLGGLRVRKITDISNTGNNIVREYKYERNGVSSGILFNNPIIFYPAMKCRQTGESSLYLRAVSPSSYRIPNESNINVAYSYVEEVTNNGKTTFEYINQLDNYSEEFEINIANRPNPIPNYPVFSYSKNGLLSEKVIYNNGNNPIKKINYTYGSSFIDLIDGMQMFRAYSIDAEALLCDFSTYFYKIRTYNNFLQKEVITKYETNNNISEEKEYNYNTINYLVSQITSTDSKLNKKQEKILYPSEYSTSVCKDMVTKHLVNKPIEELSLNNGLIVSGNKLEYFKLNEKIYPSKFQKLSIDNPISESVRSQYYKTHIQYHNYDFHANPNYISHNDATNIVYLWSYSGQYPVAEIKNATYTQVNTALASLGLTSIDALSKTSTPNIDKLRELRTKLTDAMVSVYSYQPLVGMLSSTDPQGITTYYSYDAFGRLKETYLMENGVKKVLQVYDYHYSNQ